ncbi:hypothetical protein BEH94_08425 [Candidatus Altiarchaeales archaeon WOR_SM1_SCG]|nr:hypothetical protein BEH94_08425 [Candidatus Altiarchaeales archaeon WOR_SM1_SCG]
MHKPKIFFLSTVFSNDCELEIKRSENLKNWFKRNETKDEIEKLGFSMNDLELCFLCRGYDNQQEGIHRRYYGVVTKGRAIRDKIEGIKNEEKSIYGNYLIFFDGDGQIPFESFLDILKQLSKKEINVVFACRRGNYGISNEWVNIQKFELFLLSSKYGVYLPDGQCGCWGFKTDILSRIPLIAKGFEIELDILSACLKNRILPTYIKTTIGNSEESTFEPIDHLIKLDFLIQKLEWNKEFVYPLKISQTSNTPHI